MKILHLNTNDISGGAARAAHRLHNTLRKNGVESFMLVQKGSLKDENIIGANKYKNFLRGNIDALPKRLYSKRGRVPWSVNWLYNPFLINKIKKIDPDIIHLHWVNNGFLSITDLERISKLGKPIVWTLHDSWAFTGGCHIPNDCEKYKKSCGKCPLLNSKKENDLSRKIFEKKKKIFEKIDLNIVTPSTWLADCAKQSTLLKDKKTTVIPNSIDEEEFKVLDKNKVRKELKLSNEKRYILFGAMSATTDKNKGFDLLVESLKYFEKKDNVELLIFGNNEDLKIDLNIKYKCFGRINDTEFLNKLYSASDVTVVPSRSENFPNIILESFASGTPAVAFQIGGIPDIIKHKENGYLVEAFSPTGLVEGIRWCIVNQVRNKGLCRNANNFFAENYKEDLTVETFKEYYKNLLVRKN